MNVPPGHSAPEYPPGSAERLFERWRQAIAAQNYPGGSDDYVVDAQAKALARFFPYDWTVDERPRVLFLGCGNGNEVRHAHDQGFDACGVTLNPNNVAHAHNVLGLSHVYFMDAHLMPAEWAGYFDAAFGFQFLEHTPAPILMLDETLRILKAGGFAYFETPGPEEWTLGGSLHHFLCYTRTQAEGLMMKAGFADVKVEEIGGRAAARHLAIYGRKA